MSDIPIPDPRWPGLAASAWRAKASRLAALARRVAADPVMTAGLVVVGLFLLAAMLAPVLIPAEAVQVDISRRLLPPSTAHWFGTDDRGRDVLARTLMGARVSLYIVVLALAITTPVGLAVGSAAGYLGGFAGGVLMRMTDVFLAFPSLILAMAFVATLGPGLDHAILAIALSSWPVLARLTYAETIRIRNSDYIAAIAMQGASGLRIVARHIVPMCLPVVIVRMTLTVSNTILTAAALGFLGLGAQPPTPEWGAVLSDGRQFMVQHWWMVAAPGAAIILVSLGFNLVGDGLRDLADPRHQRPG